MRKTNRFLKRAISVIVTGAMAISILPAANTAKAEEVKYVTMNVPYGDFYQAMGMEENYYDVVSTATTTKFKGTDGLAKGTYNNGTDILGVTYPVAMSETDYQTLSQTEKTAEDSYYFKDYEGTPDSYMTMQYEQGTYRFSADTVKENSADGLSIGNFTTASQYGDYQIDLVGVLPKGANEEAGAVIGGLTNLNISGVILTTDDNKSYGMGMLENIWVGTRVENVEVAWSVPEGNKLSNHGGVKFKTFDLNGKTLKSVKVITDKGIYNISCNLALTPYYAGAEEVKAEIVNATTMNISVPSEFEDVTVTVSYRSGRQSVYVAENASIVDGKVTLEGLPDTETEYTVTVANANYAEKKLTITYGTPVSDADTGITDAQKEKLNEFIATGTALVEKDSSLTLLSSHIQEAKELLEKKDATSAQAQELIGELEELIEEAKKNSGNSDQKKTTTITLSDKKISYTGKTAAIDDAVVTGSTGAVTYSYYSDKNCTKSIKPSQVKNAGVYYVKAEVAADTSYGAAVSNVAVLTITKAAQKITDGVTAKKLSAKKVKKAVAAFSIGAKANGSVTYKKTSGNKKITVSSSGKVKVAKGLAKGVYKIKVKVTAKATANYTAAEQTKTIKITVK